MQFQNGSLWHFVCYLWWVLSKEECLTSSSSQKEGDKEIEAIIFLMDVKCKKNPPKPQKINVDESGLWNCGTNGSASAQREQGGTSPRDAQTVSLKRS